MLRFLPHIATCFFSMPLFRSVNQVFFLLVALINSSALLTNLCFLLLKPFPHRHLQAFLLQVLLNTRQIFLQRAGLVLANRIVSFPSAASRWIYKISFFFHFALGRFIYIKFLFQSDSFILLYQISL